MIIMMIAHDAASSTRRRAAVAHEQLAMELMQKCALSDLPPLTVFKTCKLSGCKYTRIALPSRFHDHTYGGISPPAAARRL